MTLEPLLHYWAGLRRRDLVGLFALFAFTAGLLVILGPFGTANLMGFGRLIYWLAMLCIMAWLILPQMSRAMLGNARIAGMGLLPGAILLFIASSLPMTVVVAVVDLAAGIYGAGDFGPAAKAGVLAEVLARAGEFLSPAEGLPALLLALYAKVLAINMLSMGLISLVLAGQWMKSGQSAPSGPVIRPALKFFSRLPPGVGTELILLRMEDHYVRAVTRHGQALVLMRLSDAIVELDGIPGVRAHRSWWVVLAEVRSAARKGKRLELVMSEGTRVPVSASHRGAVEAALKLRAAPAGG